MLVLILVRPYINYLTLLLVRDHVFIMVNTREISTPITETAIRAEWL
jgi:hypothetical protein